MAGSCCLKGLKASYMLSVARSVFFLTSSLQIPFISQGFRARFARRSSVRPGLHTCRRCPLTASTWLWSTVSRPGLAFRETYDLEHHWPEVSQALDSRETTFGNRRPWCAGLDGDGRRDVQRSWRSSASVVLVAPGRVLTLLHLAEV